jgi:dTDP-4-amino-4,6-dideoxygalactose transaminase
MRRVAGAGAVIPDFDLVATYERRFAQATGAEHAVAFAYARTGLAAVLVAAGLVPGDQVLLSPLTCKVVPLALLGAGLPPRFVDIDRGTLNCSAEAVREAVGPRSGAVLFQRTYGLSTGHVRAQQAARDHGLFYVEDCAQCMPEPDAWSADAAIFSNNPGKPLPAGSGGVVVTNDGDLARRLSARRDDLRRMSRWEGWLLGLEAQIRLRLVTPRWYWTAFRASMRWSASYRRRPVAEEIRTEIEAAARGIRLGVARRGIRWLERRRAVADHRRAMCRSYQAGLSGGAEKAIAMQDDLPLYYFPALVEDKSRLIAEACRRRVPIVPWPINAPIYPMREVSDLEQYGYEVGGCPVAEWTAARVVGLPTDPSVSERDQRAIVELVRPYSMGGGGTRWD